MSLVMLISVTTAAQGKHILPLLTVSDIFGKRSCRSEKRNLFIYTWAMTLEAPAGSSPSVYRVVEKGQRCRQLLFRKILRDISLVVVCRVVKRMRERLEIT